MRPQRTGHGQGLLARRMLRAIDHHRQSPVASRSCCRFSPSCSHYAEELFLTRAFPVAFVMTVARVIRCNPIAVRKAHDPVRRTRRWRPRANALPTLFAVVAMSGFVVVLTAGVAEAVGVTNGCTATINGKDPATMTKSDPLVVRKHESVDVVGRVPPAIAAQGGRIDSVTHIEVAIVEGVFEPATEDDPGTGPVWGGKKDVDKYLKYGVGLYKVTGHAQGSGWSCDGSGYIELKDGNPLTKPVGGVAAAMMLVGAVGAAASARGGQPDVSAAPADDGHGGWGDSAESEEETAARRTADLVLQRDSALDATVGASCLLAIVMIIVILIFGVGGGAVAAGARKPGKGRVWGRGHPIAGFISGLVAGLGLTVLVQQFAYWPLTIVTAIVFPVVVGIICAIRAYMGRPYKVVSR